MIDRSKRYITARRRSNTHSFSRIVFCIFVRDIVVFIVFQAAHVRIASQTVSSLRSRAPSDKMPTITSFLRVTKTRSLYGDSHAQHKRRDASERCGSRSTHPGSQAAASTSRHLREAIGSDTEYVPTLTYEVRPPQSRWCVGVTTLVLRDRLVRSIDQSLINHDLYVCRSSSTSAKDSQERHALQTTCFASSSTSKYVHACRCVWSWQAHQTRQQHAMP